MTDRKLVWDLALAHLKSHPVRLGLTALAIIATACTVVWVVSGYDALTAKFDDMSDEYLGRYQAFVVPRNPKDLSVGKELRASIAEDKAVDEATSIYQFRALAQKAGRSGEGERGRRRGGERGEKSKSETKKESKSESGATGEKIAQPALRRRMSPSVVGIDSTLSPYPLVEGDMVDARDDGSGGPRRRLGEADECRRWRSHYDSARIGNLRRRRRLFAKNRCARNRDRETSERIEFVDSARASGAARLAVRRPQRSMFPHPSRKASRASRRRFL
ncbi:MAG: hypothetical protein QM811_19850 [Pirellulales bacterium]